MANTVTSLVPRIIAARGLNVLRANAVMPRLVRNESAEAGSKKGDILTFYKGGTQVVTNVTAGPTPPTPMDTDDKPIHVTIDQWKRTDFHLTDKEIGEILDREQFVPNRMEEVFAALGNNVDSYILGLYTGIWNNSGVAGTTPFATNLNAFRDGRKLLNKDKAKLDNRRVVLDPDAEANAIVLAQFLEADKRGDQGGIIQGEIGHKLGAAWHLNQNVPTHTAGTWAITGTGHTEISALATIGTSTIIIQGNSTTTTNGGSIKAGDVFFVTGDSQPYVVASDASVAVGAQATLALTILPNIRATLAAAATVTFAGGADATDSVCNLHFQRDAFIFASRPMISKSKYFGAAGHFSTTLRDPVTGISMRLEVIRQYKQWMFDVDILYGASLAEPEQAHRILG